MKIKENRFPGQAKNEKILYFSREYPLSYIKENFWYLLAAVVIGIFIFVFIGYIWNIYLALFISIIFLFFWLGIMLYLWKNTFFVVTNKRLIKFVKNALFSEHSKELKIDQINELSFVKLGILSKLFNFGNIKIVGKDKENAIWIRGLKYPDEIVQYISRLRDFLVENPDFDVDKLNPFIPRKYRKNKGK